MNVRTLSIAAALCLSMGVAAQAQRPMEGGRMHAGREAGDRASDRLMRDASQRVERAQREMRSALPIYDGHRADAIELAEIAQAEIKIGLAVDRLREQGTVAHGARVSDGRRGARQGGEKVRRSNAKLVEAGRLLEDAKSMLNRAQPDYGGHRRSAIDSIDKSLRQIHDALRSV